MYKLIPSLTCLASIAITACGYAGKAVKETNVSPWLNPLIYPNVKSNSVSPDLPLNTEFMTETGKTIELSHCEDLEKHALWDIAEVDYERWTLTDIDCSAFKRFMSAPKKSKSFNPHRFSKEWVQRLPAAAAPNLGRDFAKETINKSLLIQFSPDLIIKTVDDYKVVIEHNNIETTYELLSRGDFNYDGIEDLFIRLGWIATDSFGSAYDWIVITQFSAESHPTILWRK